LRVASQASPLEPTTTITTAALTSAAQGLITIYDGSICNSFHSKINTKKDNLTNPTERRGDEEEKKQYTKTPNQRFFCRSA
jgi:hypothetical protein